MPGATDAVPVLLVDDDPDFRTGVQRTLERSPLAVFTVADGTDALRFLRRQPPFSDAPRPAFIVLDYNLPDLNAPDVLGHLRADPALREIPVLVISQIPGPGDEAAALGAGAQAYSSKPSRVSALRTLVLDFWRAHGSPAC